MLKLDKHYISRTAIVVALLIGLVSCRQQDEVTHGAPTGQVVLTPGIDTKGQVTTTASIGEFTAFGYAHGQRLWADVNATATSNLMFNNKYSKTGNAWIGNIQTQWPDNEFKRYSFFVYSPTASAGQPIQAITSSASEVKGLKDGATTTFHTLKLMPQTTVQQWALGADQNPAAETFRFDAASWKSSLTNGVVDAAAITKWHTATTATKGMTDSKGWKGARVEVIYCLVDQTAGVGHEKNIIGYKSGIDGATADLMVRVATSWT